MIKLYIRCLVLIIGSVEVGLDIDMKLSVMTYDSINNDNFDSISDYTDRVSGVVDNDYDGDDKDNDDMSYDKDNDDMPYDKDNDDMPYDKDNDDMSNENKNEQMPDKYANDNETAITEAKYDRNMTNDELKDVDIIQKR